MVKFAGPDRYLCALAARPVEGNVEKRPGDLAVVDRVEEAHPGPGLALTLVEKRVDARPDPAYCFAIPVGGPQRPTLVRAGWVAAGQPVVDAEPKRGHPFRVAAMQTERHVHEDPLGEQLVRRADFGASHRALR